MESRPVRIEDPSDIHQLTRRWETFWKIPLVTPLHEVEEDLTEPHMDLERQTRGVWDGDRMVAYGQIWHRPSGVILERAYLQGRVDPEYRVAASDGNSSAGRSNRRPGSSRVSKADSPIHARRRVGLDRGDAPDVPAVRDGAGSIIH